MNGSAIQFDTRTMNLALKIIDGVTAERGRSPFAALAQGIMPTSLPDLGYDEAVRVAELGSELLKRADAVDAAALPGDLGLTFRSEEHTSELQSLMRISSAVFCLQKKKQQTNNKQTKITSTHEGRNTTDTDRRDISQ